MEVSEKIIDSWCNSCGRDTAHDIVHLENIATFETPDSEITARKVAVRCRGCKELAIRNEEWHYDRTPDPLIDNEDRVSLTVTSYSPPRLWRRRPEWVKELEQTEPDLNDLLNELYLAANDHQVRLLATGVRSALDYVMTKIVGDVGDFPAKLRAMVNAGHLTQKQSEMLDTVIDTGSAAAHRGFKPPKELLQEMMQVMETVIRDHYLTGPLLIQMKSLVPPRPPRQPRR
jgi:hypothetical protein